MAIKNAMVKNMKCFGGKLSKDTDSDTKNLSFTVIKYIKTPLFKK